VELERFGKSATKVQDEDTGAVVIQFTDKLDFEVKSTRSVLNLELKVDEKDTDTRFQVGVESNNQLYTLVYTQSHTFIQGEGATFTFGFGDRASGRWHRLTRDLYSDLRKGFSLLGLKKNLRALKKTKLKVLNLSFFGRGKLANISLSESEDLQMFLNAADWFLKSQDKQGGWPSNVVFNHKRKKYPQAKEIQPGWYGAMCQGQAISVLSRAYHTTHNLKYLQAAEAALQPFLRDSDQGGVRAHFMNQMDWYEEYPTNPSSFILNGFMFSLIGLYDLSVLNPANKLPGRLFNRGMESLEKLLPLYDTGSGTFYDLRHFTMKATPNIARWDYHSTHINQLLLLSSLHATSNSSVLASTAERWRGYMVGKRAPHN